MYIIHDMIDYILYDTLETPNLKQPLVGETGGKPDMGYTGQVK